MTETVSNKYSGEINPPLKFDRWHGLIAKANKEAEMDTVSIPAQFTSWLQSMKVETPKAATPATSPVTVPAELTAKLATAGK